MMFEQWQEMNRRGVRFLDAAPQRDGKKGNGPDPDDADGVAV
jgi:hypothetical protein